MCVFVYRIYTNILIMTHDIFSEKEIFFTNYSHCPAVSYAKQVEKA